MTDTPRKEFARGSICRTVTWALLLMVLFFSAYGCTFISMRPKNVLRTVFYTAPRAESVESQKFSSTMERLTDSTAVEGNRVKLLTNGEEVFPSMLDAIEGARKCISLEMYKIRMDRTGARFVKALASAAQRGVRVRLLYDAYGSRSVDYGDFTELIEAGVEVSVFNPVMWVTFLRVNNRDHRKILVVDGRIAFLGGLNLADEYDGDGLNGWRDTALMIEGPAARDAEMVFNESWLQGGWGLFGKDLPVVGINPVKRAIDKPLVQLLDLEGACFSGDNYSGGGAACVRVIPSNPDFLSSTIVDEYLLAINSARKSIAITCAYFLPPLVVRRALVEAVTRGVRVRLIVQGFSDTPLVRTMSVGYYGRLLKHGVEIYEWDKSVLHAKTMVVDGVWSTIGSANLNNRALFLSYEVNAEVIDHQLAVAMEEQFERDLKYCRRVTLEEWKKRPLSQKIVEFMMAPIAGQF